MGINSHQKNFLKQMKNINITKIDSKGRVLIPRYLRESLNVSEGKEIIILPDAKKNQIKILPLSDSHNLRVTLSLIDTPGSLAGIANILARYNIDIITSESKTITSGQKAEWNIIMDISKCKKDIEGIKNILLGSNYIKELKIKN